MNAREAEDLAHERLCFPLVWLNAARMPYSVVSPASPLKNTVLRGAFTTSDDQSAAADRHTTVAAAEPSSVRHPGVKIHMAGPDARFRFID